MIDVVNKTCSAGVVEEFKFQDTSIAFRVKNFSDGLIRVCLGKAWDDAQAVTVGSGIAETVISIQIHKRDLPERQQARF